MISNKMSNWKKKIITKKFTIKETIKNLNSNPFHICLLVNKKNQLIGSITDGDIRRAIIKGYSLDDKVEKICNKNPLKGNEKMNLQQIKYMMIKNVILHLPIVDKKNKINNVYSLQKIHSGEIINSTFFIMAGGKGKRLMPLTKKIPKPLLKIMGKPIIEHIIINAKNKGFKKFVISLNYLAKKIINTLGDGSRFGVKINYILEKKELGTAGSLGFYKNKSNEPIILSNADILTDINYTKFLKFHKDSKADLTIAVRKHEIKNPFAVIKIEGGKMLNIDEKPVISSYINAGIYAISKKF